MTKKLHHKLSYVFAAVAFVLLFAACITVFSISADAAEKSKVSNPELSFAAHNLSYSDSVYILYAVANEGFDRTDYEIKMLFWTDVQEDYALGTEKYSTAARGKTTVKGKNCLVFYSEGLAAKEMSTDVYSRACVEIDGEVYYSEVIKFSVLDYVHEKKNVGGLSSTQITLFDNMLDYGTAAQNNFDHNTGKPANGTYRKLTVNGGACPDGFDYGRYLQGDKVVISSFVGTDIKLDGVEYKFVKQDEILAVVTD